ncbi:MAG TPA: M3 family metallopeptidase [Gammaproteobacteria bacterium]|nr:M3 family metallopeptidase [Gammaproteobacteria bacterium]
MPEPTDIDRNPLLDTHGLPRFADIRPEHIEPAVRHVIGAQTARLAELSAVDNPNVEWLEALESVYEAVNLVWSPVAHLNAVDSSPALRDAYNACIPLITDFYTDLGQNRALYERFAALHEAHTDLEPVVRQIVRLGVRDFQLAGVALEGAERERYKEVMQSLAACQAKFEQNLMDSTDAFTHHVTDESQLAGIPAVFVERAAESARKDNLDGWLLRLDPPTYQAVMSHAEHEGIREAYYRAWNTRASDEGPTAGKWDNGPLIEEILALRREAADLLGFGSYAEQSIATKMADSTDAVIDFLRDLARRSRSLAQRDLARLEELAQRELNPWDVGFFCERLRKVELGLSEEALRPYFPLASVLDGLFELAGTLFGIQLVEQPAPQRWHDSVRYYSLRDATGTEIGGLFTDFFARPNKRGGAWMDVCRNRSAIGETRQLPVAHLVCNFNAPFGTTPSLLTHSDVVTLFHEFGHSIHHLLTEVAYPSLAGINGVAWDAVELPSQFLENFAFLPDVLDRIARHYETGERLPGEIMEKLQKSRAFLAGLAMVRQLEFALFDFLLHSAGAKPKLAQVRALLDEVRQEVAVIFPPEYHRFAHSFSHIFAGGYAAGYYSYKWAEVLAADSFAAFRESGYFDRDTAERFRRSILAVGGSCDAIDAFVAFRGRPPKLEPLLEQSGISLDDARAA